MTRTARAKEGTLSDAQADEETPTPSVVNGIAGGLIDMDNGHPGRMTIWRRE
jgi:hypothetical protein